MNEYDAESLAELIDRLIKLNIMVDAKSHPPGWDTESIQRFEGMKCDIEKVKSDLAKYLQGAT